MAQVGLVEEVNKLRDELEAAQNALRKEHDDAQQLVNQNKALRSQVKRLTRELEQNEERAAYLMMDKLHIEGMSTVAAVNHREEVRTLKQKLKEKKKQLAKSASSFMAKLLKKSSSGKHSNDPAVTLASTADLEEVLSEFLLGNLDENAALEKLCASNSLQSLPLPSNEASSTIDGPKSHDTHAAASPTPGSADTSTSPSKLTSQHSGIGSNATGDWAFYSQLVLADKDKLERLLSKAISAKQAQPTTKKSKKSKSMPSSMLPSSSSSRSSTMPAIKALAAPAPTSSPPPAAAPARQVADAYADLTLPSRTSAPGSSQTPASDSSKTSSISKWTSKLFSSFSSTSSSKPATVVSKPHIGTGTTPSRPADTNSAPKGLAALTMMSGLSKPGARDADTLGTMPVNTAQLASALSSLSKPDPGFDNDTFSPGQGLQLASTR